MVGNRGHGAFSGLLLGSVTGASSGIGREIAVQLADAGFDLVLVARRETLLRELAADLAIRHGVDVRVLVLDLALDEGVEELMAATAGTDIGLYVAAAGFGTSGPFLDADLDQEREMLQLHCAAVLATSLVFGRRMADRGSGGIILMSSIVGFQGMPNAAHYAATKAYVQTLAEALHVEVRPRGVDVLAAAPGPTHSGFAARADMRMGRALSAHAVAQGTLAALGHRPTALPGLLSRVLKYSLAPLHPRPDHGLGDGRNDRTPAHRHGDEGHGATIVLIHGVPETAALWDKLRSFLPADTLAIDQPGFGCPRPEGFAATPDAYAGWLVGEIERIGPPVDLVGHDWGADETMARCVLDLYRAATPNPHARWQPTRTAVPGLVLDAPADPFGPQPLSLEVAHLLGAEIAHLPGLGHWWALQDPARAAAELTAFWRSVEGHGVRRAATSEPR